MSDELPPLGPELEGLFDAARRDLPSAAMKAKARAALGLPAPVVSATPSPASPPTAPPSGSAGAGAGTVAGAGSAATTASIGATVVKGLLVVGLAGGAYLLGVRTGETRARDEFAALPPKTVVVERVVEKEVEKLVIAPIAEPVDAGRAIARRPAEPAPEVDDLPAELALLDAARGALAAKDGARALSVLAKYEATFPRGAMVSDARLLRLEALLLAGKRADAEALAKKLAATTDSELVRERVRRLLDAR